MNDIEKALSTLRNAITAQVRTELETAIMQRVGIVKPRKNANRSIHFTYMGLMNRKGAPKAAARRIAQSKSKRAAIAFLKGTRK